ncbi:MAG: hypothetical protein H7Z38_00390 [Rubrivivax sp.]|nr:hypothetical protein [Pyrinomonadaceae bacterium]
MEKGIIRIGFGSEQSQRFELCQSGQWNDLSESFIDEGKDKGTATRFTNELRLFFEDEDSMLWITFMGERLCWGMIDHTMPALHADANGVWRPIRDGWQWTDLHGEQLTKDRLSGALTKLTAYRGTSCNVDKNVSSYVIRRINGEKTPEVERALAASKEMKASALGLMKLLEPRDFELLVDLVFTTSGWQRVSSVGGTRKTLDLDLILPSTGERAFVQVKSKTTSDELADYVAKIEDGPYDRMFYVFHSGKAEMEKKDQRVTIIGPEQLADLVMEAGLVSWLIRKVS